MTDDTQNSESFAFDAEHMAQAEKIIAKYPEGWQASAVLPLLDLAQRQNANFLSQAAMDYVAEMLKMPPIRVYEVATFYTMYNLKPMGKHHVQVCTNLPCWLRGSDDIVKTCKEFIGVGMGQTSEDGMFTLTEAECLGACVNAPMVQIGDDYFEDLDVESTLAVLSELKAGKTPKNGS
ncbi:MAG: NADH-quinone oxidoreductase subunit NuoE, partial [Rhodospirillaceae bacterium]|nr:NADH-quinone oxidoreductase subunit NuoE [Rhodospirillaceae bacterium]